MTTPRPQARDRRQLLLAPGAALNGIDYVGVAASQTRLFVHFLNEVPVLGSPDGLVATIAGGPAAASVAIGDPADWTTDSEGRPVLALAVNGVGDYSAYTLTILSPQLDPFFQSAAFTFQAACPTALNGAAPAPGGSGQAAEEVQVPIDYLAKDFASFRQALSEFSTGRYPAWVERSEADLGVVLMEALAAMADELSYYQDRVFAESTIQTATQRVSVLRHARLVDYEPAPATTATTVLQLNVVRPPTGTSWKIDTPLQFRALGADGAIVYFEIEDPATGLAGPAGGPPPAWATVDIRWNQGSLPPNPRQPGIPPPYYWDDSTRILPAGATEFYLAGHDIGLYPGQQLLLDTPAATSGDPPVRELVTVSATTPILQTSDPLFDQPLTLVPLAGPTAAAHDLSQTVVAGNVVPAVQGIRQTETFEIPGPAKCPPGPAVVRAGPNQASAGAAADFRYCLMSGPLAWLAVPEQDADTVNQAQPEIVLTVQGPEGSTQSWEFRRWLLGSDASDPVFTLTPEQYSAVLTSNGRTWYDYDGDGGTTIRFGDGTFGSAPLPGTVFTVLYRVGGGTAGNVPADTIVTVAPGQPQGPVISACTNPFAAAGGVDAETIAQVRARAPQSFRAQPLSLVRPADYAAAAQSLPWVQQAGTTSRWTGSWLTVLTSANPAAAEEPTTGQLTGLAELLNQRRLAGYESYVLPPNYVSVDLRITVRGQPTAFASQVQAAVLARLQPGALAAGGTGSGSTASGSTGFFDHARWGFGQPLESSALLAAIQACPGVAGVTQVLYRQTGATPAWTPLPDTLTVAADQILRVDNDPARPQAGSLRVTVEGAK